MERTQVGGHKMATVGALVVDKMEVKVGKVVAVLMDKVRGKMDKVVVQVDKVVAIMDKVRNKVQAQENKEGAQ